MLELHATLTRMTCIVGGFRVDLGLQWSTAADARGVTSLLAPNGDECCRYVKRCNDSFISQELHVKQVMQCCTKRNRCWEALWVMANLNAHTARE